MFCRPIGKSDPLDVDDDDVKRCVISYASLCENAHLGREFARTSRLFLFEIAEECERRDWPPLNALAVNAQSGYPGDGYNQAPGTFNWEGDVKRVVAFTDYLPQID